MRSLSLIIALFFCGSLLVACEDEPAAEETPQAEETEATAEAPGETTAAEADEAADDGPEPSDEELPIPEDFADEAEDEITADIEGELGVSDTE